MLFGICLEVLKGLSHPLLIFKNYHRSEARFPAAAISLARKPRGNSVYTHLRKPCACNGKNPMAFLQEKCTMHFVIINVWTIHVLVAGNDELICIKLLQRICQKVGDPLHSLQCAIQNSCFKKCMLYMLCCQLLEIVFGKLWSTCPFRVTIYCDLKSWPREGEQVSFQGNGHGFNNMPPKIRVSTYG